MIKISLCSSCISVSRTENSKFNFLDNLPWSQNKATITNTESDVIFEDKFWRNNIDSTLRYLLCNFKSENQIIQQHTVNKNNKKELIKMVFECRLND
jgi:hypothetical protein